MVRVIIIGGNAAGLSAASRIRRMQKDWEIIVYEKSEFISYGGCGIPYYVQEIVPELQNLITLTEDDVINKRKIPLKINHEVIGIDFKRKMVMVKNRKTNGVFEDKYDYLFIGTGAEPVFPRSFSISKDHKRLVLIHTLEQARNLREMLREEALNAGSEGKSDVPQIKRIIVIGTGFIGQEMLEAYSHYPGIEEITAIDPIIPFPEKLKSVFFSELEKHNIRFINDFVDDIKEKSEYEIEVNLRNGEILTADLVQVSIGVRPATDFLKDKGLEMDKNGAIIIDEYCRTNIEGVYAGGDCATVYHKILKRNTYVPLAPAANKLGRLAGTHIAKGTADPFKGIVGTAIWKFFDLHCARTGISRKEAEEMGYEVEETLIENREIAHYIPSDARIRILLRFDKNSAKLLGANIIANTPMGAKKIDVLSTALIAEMTIPDIQQLDLAYAPHYSPVYDPILIAANVARKKCKK